MFARLVEVYAEQRGVSGLGPAAVTTSEFTHRRVETVVVVAAATTRVETDVSTEPWFLNLARRSIFECFTCFASSLFVLLLVFVWVESALLVDAVKLRIVHSELVTALLVLLLQLPGLARHCFEEWLVLSARRLLLDGVTA